MIIGRVKFRIVFPLLEIPNETYITLSQFRFAVQSRVLQADRSILEINEKATLNINMPYWSRV